VYCKDKILMKLYVTKRTISFKLIIISSDITVSTWIRL